MSKVVRAALLSGERGSGKTTLCMRLAGELRDVGGIVSPAVFDGEGIKTGFRCVCLQSCEEWDLGSVKPGFERVDGPRNLRQNGETPVVRTAAGEIAEQTGARGPATQTNAASASGPAGQTNAASASGVAGSAATDLPDGRLQGPGTHGSGFQTNAGAHGPGNQETGKFAFSQSGIHMAIGCIRGSLESKSGVTCIDEIGPLELLKGGGFAPVLPLLTGAGDLLIVVRAALVDLVLQYVDGHRWCHFDLTKKNRDTIGADIISFFTDPR